MFKVPQPKVAEFAKLFDIHRMQISACDVFYQNIRMLNGRHTILDRDSFVEYYKTFTSDIELESSPIDAFVPCDQPSVDENGNEIKHKLFVVNQTMPDYQRIQKRVTLEELKSTLPETHPAIMALAENKVTLGDIIDDIYIYFCLFKYIEQIERLRIQIFSNMTPVIEYLVTNINIYDVKRYLISSKINKEKIAKYDDLLFFTQDFQMICDFYKNETNPENDIPYFDLENLIDRLMSNIVLKSDIYIILGMYLTASFAVADFKGHATDSPCVNYVRDVLVVV